MTADIDPGEMAVFDDELHVPEESSQKTDEIIEAPEKPITDVFENQIDWEALVYQINRHKVLPIINDIVPDNFYVDFVQNFAEQFNQFVHFDKIGADLTQIGQYLVSSRGDYLGAKFEFLDFYKQQMISFTRKNSPDQFSYEFLNELEQDLPDLSVSEVAKRISFPAYEDESDNPIVTLATLPIPVYITASYFDFLEEALRSNGKSPQTEISYWNSTLSQRHPSIFAKNADYRPSVEEPLVLHLFGIESLLESLVLTEDDLLDFTANIQESDVIPVDVRARLVDCSLLILGFDTTKLDFKTLYRNFIVQNRTIRRSPNILVHQTILDHESDLSPDEQLKSVERNFEKENFSVYHGKPAEFSKELLENATSE